MATNDCDAGVPHVAHSRRDCLVSSATTGPTSLHGDEGWLWTQTTSQVTAGSRKCSQLPARHTASVSSTTSTRKYFTTSVFVDNHVQTEYSSRGFRERRELTPRRAQVTQLSRHTHNRCRKHRAANLGQRYVHKAAEQVQSRAKT